jgi:hypothetical protein
MNRQADPALLRWLMLPAEQADFGHLKKQGAQDCARALRFASRRLQAPVHDIHAFRRNDVAELVNWLRQDLTSLRWGLYLAGAWVFGAKLRMQAGQTVTPVLARMLGARQLLAILRSDDLSPEQLPPLTDTDDVLAAGGVLMSAHCQQAMPTFADRLLQRFPPDESAMWREAPQVRDEAWRERVAAQVLRARPEAMS